MVARMSHLIIILCWLGNASELIPHSRDRGLFLFGLPSGNDQRYWVNQRRVVRIGLRAKPSLYG